MRIASWNVNSVKGALPIITHWLASDRCDVLLMQETKSQDENFPQQLFADAGWYTAFHGQKVIMGWRLLAACQLRMS